MPLNAQISDGAAKLLVSEYKRLRMGDSNNSATSSWRITVRQLESLIRLSEALARLHCESEVSACMFLIVVAMVPPAVDVDGSILHLFRLVVFRKK